VAIAVLLWRGVLPQDGEAPRSPAAPSASAR